MIDSAHNPDDYPPLNPYPVTLNPQDDLHPSLNPYPVIRNPNSPPLNVGHGTLNCFTIPAPARKEISKRQYGERTWRR